MSGMILASAGLILVECDSLDAAKRYCKLQSDFLGRRYKIVGWHKLTDRCFRVLFMTDSYSDHQMHVSDLLQFFGDADVVDLEA